VDPNTFTSVHPAPHPYWTGELEIRHVVDRLKQPVKEMLEARCNGCMKTLQLQVQSQWSVRHRFLLAGPRGRAGAHEWMVNRSWWLKPSPEVLGAIIKRGTAQSGLGPYMMMIV